MLTFMQWHWLNILATELHLRLKEARDESPGLWVRRSALSSVVD